MQIRTDRKENRSYQELRGRGEWRVIVMGTEFQFYKMKNWKWVVVMVAQ